MWKRFDEKAAQIDRATPEDRDRYADFLRVLAIVVVVVGHWLAPHLSMGAAGVRLRLVHGMVEPLEWLTWLFQVMPLFFFVGGMVNALSWEKAASDDAFTYVDWLRRRARRLLWPLVPLLLAWMVAAPVLEALGVESRVVSRAAHAMLYPIWFLGAYLCVVAAAPLAYWLHRRLGWLALAGLITAALAVDAVAWAGLEEVAWINFVFVWGAIHQAGFFWYDRGLPKRATVGVAIAVAALAGLWTLVQSTDYATTMVATGFETRPNDLPPTIALVILAIAQFGVVAAARTTVEDWLHRPRLWALISMGGRRIMTVYLWHMSAMVVVALAVVPTEIWPMPTDADTTWWLLRIPWIVVLSVALAAFVGAFGRFEQPETAPPTTRRGLHQMVRALASVALVTLAIARLMLDGLYAGGGIAGLAWVPLVVLALGLVGLGVFERD